MDIDFDDILAKVGDFGRYQWVMYFIICLPASVPSAWTAFNQVFVAAVPKHWCKNDSSAGKGASFFNYDNQSHSDNIKPVFYKKCQESFILPSGFYEDDLAMKISNETHVIECRDFEFDRTVYDNTIVTEFNLVCEHAYLPAFSTMVFYIGSLIGNIIFGYVADKWGRRASFFAILAIQVGFGTANSFATNIYVFTCLRFVVGLTFPALYQIPFIIAMELIGPSKRIFAGMVVCIIFGLAMCALGFIASLIRSWSMITFVSNAPFALLFSYWWILPESPRWLITEGRIEQAHRHLLKIAKFNKKIVDPLEIRRDCETLYYATTNNKQDESKHKMIDLIKTRNMRIRFMLISYIWFVNAVVYNGLTFNVSNLEVDDYVSFMINGAVEVPAYLITWVGLDKMGRRWSLFISMLIGGAACMSTMFFPPDDKWIISGLAFVGKFGIAASFGIIYIFAGELYPTVVRAMGMGMSSMIAGIGLLLAPYLVSLGAYVRILPLLIMGVFTITAGILSLFLPETTAAPLLQSIEEAERFRSTRRLLSLKSKRRKTLSKANISSDDEFELKRLTNRNNCPVIIIDED